MMRKLLTAVVIAGLFGGGACLAAKTESPAKTDTNTAAAEHQTGHAEKKTENRAMEGYIGIAVEPLHSALVERLERLFGRGQGVLVARVAEGSPAEKAGLEANDVVVTYDEQKIYSPVQLGRLVQNDKPGREATLGIVRSGQSKEVKVQVGDRADMHAVRGLESLSGERPRRAGTAKEMDETWSSFDSLVLERTGENHFKAAIKYRDTNGRIASREFQGSIADIRKDVEAQHDMPAIERQHLLRAVAASERPTEFAMPRPRVAHASGTNAPRVEREEVDWTIVF
jgi:membrane-associated protease RseP (regulator of RpoE activity)